ncbi:hypothetical protein M758_8G073300 [Ceratodon purpureus]|nr:hypothetical protein M758_8G073300 [Ceratodon purpureus]
MLPGVQNAHVVVRLQSTVSFQWPWPWRQLNHRPSLIAVHLWAVALRCSSGTSDQMPSPLLATSMLHALLCLSRLSVQLAAQLRTGFWIFRLNRQYMVLNECDGRTV